jgi:hypothetical protein
MTHPAAGHPAIRPTVIRVMSLSLLFLLSGCSEPFIVMSGESLAGDVVDPPTDWTPLNDVEIVQLETRPSDPYSVNIWMVGLGSDVYVATGSDDTNWTEYIDEDTDVRLRVEGRIYELEAFELTDNREKRTVAAAYVEKYGLDAEDNWVLDGQVFRLDRR